MQAVHFSVPVHLRRLQEFCQSALQVCVSVWFFSFAERSGCTFWAGLAIYALAKTVADSVRPVSPNTQTQC